LIVNWTIFIKKGRNNEKSDLFYEENLVSPSVKVFAVSLLSRINLKSNLISRRIILMSPVKTSMTIPVSIFDSSGRIVKNFNVSFKTKEETIDASSFSSGIYFLQIGNSGRKMRKLTILKQ